MQRNVHDMPGIVKGLLIPDDHDALSEGCKDFWRMDLKESRSRRTTPPFNISVRDDSKGCPFEHDVRATMRLELVVIGGERLGMGVVFPRWTDSYPAEWLWLYHSICDDSIHF